MKPRTRSRIVLLVIAALFLSSFGVALFLHYSGWAPTHTRNHGAFVKPPVALGGLVLRRADGSAHPWQPRAGIWRVLVVPPADCGASCLELVDTLRRVWVGEGRHADRLEVLWFGEVPAGAAVFRNLVAMRPDPALGDALPAVTAEQDAIPVFVADPAGYVVLHYPPGFDPGGLRRDLARLLK